MGQNNRQSLPLAALGPLWQNGAAMNESEEQSSFTRAASITTGLANNPIPISFRASGLTTRYLNL
jgi:hypothetical protein